MSNYITFSSTAPFTIQATKTWDGVLYWSTDAQVGQTWGGEMIESAEHNGEHRIYMRGIQNTVISDSTEWVLVGSDIRCEGNIENLLDWDMVANGEHPSMGDACYAYMFNNCTSLTTAPELPATTVTRNCYHGMFQGCTSLKNAPHLPATELQRNCYRQMFDGCTSLKISETQTVEYTVEYRIPTNGTGTTATGALTDMFVNTGGTFTGTPSINTTYYGAWGTEEPGGDEPTGKINWAKLMEIYHLDGFEAAWLAYWRMKGGGS